MSDKPTRLEDYRPPAWQVPEIELEFDLGIDTTEITARLHLTRGAGEEQPLRLDGEALELLAISLDGRRLGPLEYRRHEDGLEVPGARHGSVLETRVRVRPADNSALQGLYLSGARETGFLLTQCEAEGFRRITYFPDRPDVLSRYTVTLRAEASRFPVLLAGGNTVEQGTLEDGRHYARFVDPWPKPSYLFALVAGALEHIEREFVTAEGRHVRVCLWSEAWAIARCDYAMESVLAAMRWDEQRYGRCYDLDVFHVVATGDFNMGAMENKGLNIFNTKYLLADPDTATDIDYARIEAVIGHEYFHNWSGNRVTCRDWFQLSLKEGFTVFREQSFAADRNGAALQRIDDVSRLKQVQFAEDASPLAHPVRPTSYREIDNFYTTTVYEKGAELVRMLACRLGDDGFRRGTDLYFARHDGQAVTIEDFLQALGDANDVDLMPYLAWYTQAGTPVLHASSKHDAASARYTIEFSQSTAPTPGQPHKRALPIPVAMALLDSEGRPLPLRLSGESAPVGHERILEVVESNARFVFEDVPTRPVASLLRGFSAPVLLEDDAGEGDLALLLRHESSGFDRWLAAQRLARRAFREQLAGDRRKATEAWCKALHSVFRGADRQTDAALVAELLSAPGETELGQTLVERDPGAVHVAREQLLGALAGTLGAGPLADRYRQFHADGSASRDAVAHAHRSLKHRLLALLCRVDRAAAMTLATEQFHAARCMTDRIGALTLLLHFDGPAADDALAVFRQRHHNDALAIDKCIAAQATIPGSTALARVRALLAGEDYLPRNPNRVNALLGTFANANPSGFHREDGAGYTLLAHELTVLDRLNPISAARLANAFAGWTRLEPVRREHARKALASLSTRELSRGLGEMVKRLAEPA